MSSYADQFTGTPKSYPYFALKFCPCRSLAATIARTNIDLEMIWELISLRPALS